jgi:hypothetical protein
MPSSDLIEKSLEKLIHYIEAQNYRGWDPYDALKSPLFKFPVLRSNKKLRFLSQQFVKRFPVNLRPLLAIPKGYNPVTLGLCLQGYSYLAQRAGRRAQGSPTYHLSHFNPPSGGQGGSRHRAQGNNSDISLSHFPPFSPPELQKRIEFLINELKQLIPPGYHGPCWGYDFPWEARYVSIPAYQPTVVATGIIVNALYIAYKTIGIEECAELVKSSAQFVLKDLKRTYSDDNYILSYSPFDNQQVLNASMKGARILAQAYELSGDENLKTEARKTVEFVVSQQHEDGSWGYSLAEGGSRTDNYHTGYVLDCLHEYSVLCDDRTFGENLKRGYQFYKDHFIKKNGMPRFYSDKAYPADCTAAAQTILTLTRFGDKELAERVALWMIENMQSGSGSFYYRKYRHYKNRTSFMRWSDAWMFAPLSKLHSESSSI